MRRLTSVAVAAAVAAAPLVFATPAMATTTNASISCTFFANIGFELAVNPTSINAESGDIIRVTVGNPMNVNVSLVGLSGAATIVGPGSEDYLVTSSNGGTITMSTTQGACSASAPGVISIVGTGGGPSSDTTMTESAPAPVETLTLSAGVSGGAVCTGGETSGTSGSWLTLPSADQCHPSSTAVDPTAELLGWSTSAAFPQSIAEHQLDMGWGAWDGDVDGIRMIFIPAGQATFVSGSNQLFPIWAR